ncbi:unnamed protein product, partial [Ectocarpus sp. 8 AP-2014]
LPKPKRRVVRIYANRALCFYLSFCSLPKSVLLQDDVLEKPPVHAFHPERRELNKANTQQLSLKTIKKK